MIGYKRINKKVIGDLLIDQGVINRQQLDKAIVHQKERGGFLGEILIGLGYVLEEDVAHALTSQYGFPYLPLASYEIDHEIVLLVPLTTCEKFCLVPIDKIGESLTLAMADPFNIQAIEEIETFSGCCVQAFVSTATDVRNAIKKYYS